VLWNKGSLVVRRDARSHAEPRSARKKAIFTSLTDMTEAALGLGAVDARACRPHAAAAAVSAPA
jgi:hypothetical protein